MAVQNELKMLPGRREIQWGCSSKLQIRCLQPDDRCEVIAFPVKDSAPNPEEVCAVHQRQLKTLRAIGRLSPQLRAPIRMQLMREWSIREIR
jgi:DNA-directed RNA polymerase specialized sigma24 family protein